ncbi:RlmF-related methyltransferase [Candidatus Lokiarchaeum ossiferum]|uniref:RlmF-related methyltransferase n=1 Tax=Candidatus Lokiarchaeum ossiferum TaxID=2951803 RepID=UPI00352E9153
MGQEKFDDIGIPLFYVERRYPTSRAIELHPDLIPFLKTRDPPRINKESREALLLYNYYVAQDLFNLTIEFERDVAIVPTPVMRYAFLQHLIHPNCSIIELGTGASAIIALIAAKCFNAQVYATEMDPTYIEYAKRNVSANKLENKIQVINSHGKFLDGIIPENLKVDFIISNPPYYDKILSPKILWGGKKHELVGEGSRGENFIISMIEEGWKYLKTPGCIAFIIPKTRVATMNAIEEYLNEQDLEFDIIGILAGNRTRYVFKIYKKYFDDRFSEFDI